MHVILHQELSPAAEGRPLAEVRGRMELEYELAERAGAACALLHFCPEGLAYLEREPARRAAARAALLAACLALPRRGDLVALEHEGAWRILLTRCTPAEAEGFAAALLAAARHLELPGEKSPLRLPVALGLACSQPEQELFFETLALVAAEGAEVASRSGGGSAVHTQLYALHQRRLERDRPGQLPPPKGAAAAAETHPVPHTANGTHAQHSQHAQHAAPAAARPQAETFAAPGAADLEARVRELAAQWAQAGLAEQLAERERAHAREVELLQRRIAKLNGELTTCEESLRAVARGPRAEAGLASVFREVQGLDQGERGYAAKLALLGEILEANLVLRRAREAT